MFLVITTFLIPTLLKKSQYKVFSKNQTFFGFFPVFLVSLTLFYSLNTEKKQLMDYL